MRYDLTYKVTPLQTLTAVAIIGYQRLYTLKTKSLYRVSVKNYLFTESETVRL